MKTAVGLAPLLLVLVLLAACAGGVAPTSTPTPTGTLRPTPTATATRPGATPTATATRNPTPAGTLRPTATVTPTGPVATPTPTLTPTPTPTPTATPLPPGDPAMGQQVAQRQGCLACHTADGSPSLGPTWLGLYGKLETLQGNISVRVEEPYLVESIRNPTAKVVLGFGQLMPVIPLTDEELQDVVAYIKSLQGTAAEGSQIVQGKGCLACHTVDGRASTGPTWLGLYGKLETLQGGQRVLVDETYLSESIRQPGAKVVQGFEPVMPTIPLTAEELQDVVAYIKSLGADPERGRQVAQREGCLSCHTTDGTAGTAPTWLGLYGKVETLLGNQTIIVDEVYLEESIRDPNAKVVQGYTQIMPAIPLTIQEVQDIIAFIKTLK